MSTLIASIILALMGVLQPAAMPLAPQQTPVAQGKPSVPPTKVCLNEMMAKQGIEPGVTRVPKMLYGIKRPTRDNVTQGYEIEQCRGNGGCGGPASADYLLIAKDVVVDHAIFPNSYLDSEPLSDRQLVRQTDISDTPVLADRYKNRIFRTH